MAWTCSPRHAKHCSPAHALMVENYRAARHAWECDLEQVTMLYPVEEREFRAERPAPVLSDWMPGQQIPAEIGADLD